VVVAREVVVTVTSRANPSYFATFFGDCEHASVNSLTVDRLLFVPSDAVHVSKRHELLDWPVHKNEVTSLKVMRIQQLLLLKP
jgi:hypothetical protein